MGHISQLRQKDRFRHEHFLKWWVIDNNHLVNVIQGGVNYHLFRMYEMGALQTLERPDLLLRKSLVTTVLTL